MHGSVYGLFVTVDSAMMEGVKKFFSIGKKKPKELSDPYMTFQFAGKSIQSKVMYETYSPEFNQELKLAFKVSNDLSIFLGCMDVRLSHCNLTFDLF